MIESTTHYIVQVFVKAQPTFKREAHWEYLAVEGGYCSHTYFKSHAHRFTEVPTVEQVRTWSGMPWMCDHDKRVKPRVFKVTETREEVQLD